MSDVVVIEKGELAKLLRKTMDDALDAHRAVVAEVLTREQAAELLLISVPSLMGHVDHDGLPAHRVGVQWRFRRSEVLRWLDGRGTDVKLQAVKG